MRTRLNGITPYWSRRHGRGALNLWSKRICKYDYFAPYRSVRIGPHNPQPRNSLSTLWPNCQTRYDAKIPNYRLPVTLGCGREGSLDRITHRR